MIPACISAFVILRSGKPLHRHSSREKGLHRSFPRIAVAGFRIRTSIPICNCQRLSVDSLKKGCERVNVEMVTVVFDVCLVYFRKEGDILCPLSNVYQYPLIVNEAREITNELCKLFFI